jgi:hypothetical protein
MIKIRTRFSLKHHVIMVMYYMKDVPAYAIMTYGAKVQIHSFSTSATGGGKANFTTGRYSPRERAPVPTEKFGWFAESIWALRLAPDGNQTKNARLSPHSVVSILPTLSRLRDILRIILNLITKTDRRRL